MKHKLSVYFKNIQAYHKMVFGKDNLHANVSAGWGLFTNFQWAFCVEILKSQKYWIAFSM